MKLHSSLHLLLWTLAAFAGLGALVALADEDALPEEPAVLDVQVLDAGSGRALERARVVVYDEDYEPIREAETDAGGEVRFVLPQGRYGAVAAFAEGHAFGHSTLYALSGRSRHCSRVLRLPAALVLEGHVLAARGGEPVAGARLSLRALEVGGMNRSIFWHVHQVVEATETDADGRFTLRRIPPRTARRWDRVFGVLEIEAAGFADVAKVLWQPEEIGEDLVIRLPEGGRVAGTVRMPDGTPATDVAVGSPRPTGGGGGVDRRLLSTDDFWHTNSSLPRTPAVVDLWRGQATRTDAAGHYALEGFVAGDRISVRAISADEDRKAHRVVTLPYGGSAARANLVLRPDAALEVLALRGSMSVADGLLSSRGSRPTPVSDARISLRRGGLPPVYTNEDGSVRFEGLAPGKYVVEASKEGLGEREAYVTLSVGEEATARVHFWSHGPTFSYRGRIVDDRGLPISGARFNVTPGGYDAQTDREGRFTVEAPGLEGMWLEADAEGHAGRRRELADVEDREALAFVLPRMTPVTVNALAPSDAPEPSRHIEVSWDGWGTWRPSLAWAAPAAPLEVTLSVDPDTPWIALTAGPYRPLVWKVAMEPGVPLVLPPKTLDPGLVLEGTLLHADGSPVDGSRRYGDLDDAFPYYEIEFWQRPHSFSAPGARRRRSVSPDAQGRWRIAGLAAGPLIVDVGLRFDSWLRFPVVVDPGMDPVQIRLPAPCCLEGRVMDAEGHPQVRATVRLYAFRSPRWPAEARRQLLRDVPTDSGGRFALEVPPGVYRVEVGSDPSRRGREDVLGGRDLTLEAGETRAVDLVVPVRGGER